MVNNGLFRSKVVQSTFSITLIPAWRFLSGRLVQSDFLCRAAHMLQMLGSADFLVVWGGEL